MLFICNIVFFNDGYMFFFYNIPGKGTLLCLVYFDIFMWNALHAVCILSSFIFVLFSEVDKLCHKIPGDSVLDYF